MIDRSQGEAFDDEAVARAYLHRPEYPTALIARLLELAAGRGRALDLGCGPGKLAHALAPHLEQVVAVDPSASMLALARETHAALPGDIRWLLGRAEDVDPGGPFDLAVAGASIHWMDPPSCSPGWPHGSRPTRSWPLSRETNPPPRPGSTTTARCSGPGSNGWAGPGTTRPIARAPPPTDPGCRRVAARASNGRSASPSTA